MQPQEQLKCWITEFRKLKRQADRAVAQVSSEDLFRTLDEEANSIAVLMKHIAGNMRSRWVDFLTADGEKPDRNRDSEFVVDDETPESIKKKWEASWKLLFDGLQSLTPADLDRSVLVRGEQQPVPEAIFRQMVHYASHVGQIILLAKHYAGDRWQTLSIPRGQSEEYNAAMRQKWTEK
ncbi:MAG TPA: DUF1572 family protein [Terriglobia bacterium]|nr:DUF1572 family protein [Terriglobia bacterium]